VAIGTGGFFTFPVLCRDRHGGRDRVSRRPEWYEFVFQRDQLVFSVLPLEPLRVFDCIRRHVSDGPIHYSRRLP
jgi:hypothetical protein